MAYIKIESDAWDEMIRLAEGYRAEGWIGTEVISTSVKNGVHIHVMHLRKKT